MYKKVIIKASKIDRNTSNEGERIESKIERVVNNNEAITDGAPIIFTERKDGVNPAYDIRTDRFEIAIEGMDIVSKSYQAKREQGIEERGKIIDLKNDKSGDTEPTQGTK